MLADARFILPGRELDEKVAGVHGGERGEEVAVGDLVGMDGVAVAAAAGVDADVGAFGGGEAGQDAVVEVGEGAEQRDAGPGVAGVVFGRQTAFGRHVISHRFSFAWISGEGKVDCSRSVKSIETLFVPVSK